MENRIWFIYVAVADFGNDVIDKTFDNIGIVVFACLWKQGSLLSSDGDPMIKSLVLFFHRGEQQFILL